ncbi:hypothetical protein ES703_19402 [subsurface metagenome]
MRVSMVVMLHEKLAPGDMSVGGDGKAPSMAKLALLTSSSRIQPSSSRALTTMRHWLEDMLPGMLQLSER